MKVLLSDPYNLVTLDEEIRLVKQTRTSTPILSLEETEECFGAVARAIAPFAHCVMLADLRNGPGNNLPDAERITKRLLMPPLQKYRAVATLVKSAVGRLQVARMWREAGLPMGVFSDEEEALVYLGVKAPTSSSPERSKEMSGDRLKAQSPSSPPRNSPLGTSSPGSSPPGSSPPGSSPPGSSPPGSSPPGSSPPGSSNDRWKGFPADPSSGHSGDRLRGVSPNSSSSPEPNRSNDRWKAVPSSGGSGDLWATPSSGRSGDQIESAKNNRTPKKP